MLDASLLPAHTDRTRLRALLPKDAAAFADGSRDTAVRRYGHLPDPSYTPDSVVAMIRDDATPGLARGDLAVLAVADTASDEFCGSLVLFDVTDHSAEVGFWLHPDHRGSGRTTEALVLAAQFAASSGLSRLTARTVPENSASRHILTRAGFTECGRTTDHAPSGRTVELIHFVRQIDDR